MKKFNKIVSGALIVGVLMSTGVTTFAATNTIEPSALASKESRDLANTQRPDKSKRSQLTDEQKVQKIDTMKENLKERLDAGEVSQEEYDQVIKDIEDGIKPMGLRKGKDRPGNMERPDLTDEEKSQIIDKMKERINERLEAGDITQEQYDRAIKDIEDGKKPRCLGKDRGKDGTRHMERPDNLNK